MICIHSTKISLLIAVFDASTDSSSKGHELPYRSQNKILATLTPLISTCYIENLSYQERNGSFVAEVHNIPFSFTSVTLNGQEGPSLSMTMTARTLLGLLKFFLGGVRSVYLRLLDKPGCLND